MRGFLQTKEDQRQMIIRIFTRHQSLCVLYFPFLFEPFFLNNTPRSSITSLVIGENIGGSHCIICSLVHRATPLETIRSLRAHRRTRQQRILALLRWAFWRCLGLSSSWSMTIFLQTILFSAFPSYFPFPFHFISSWSSGILCMHSREKQTSKQDRDWKTAGKRINLQRRTFWACKNVGLLKFFRVSHFFQNFQHLHHSRWAKGKAIWNWACLDLRWVQQRIYACTKRHSWWRYRKGENCLRGRWNGWWRVSIILTQIIIKIQF